MDESLQTIDLHDLKAFVPQLDEYSLGDDFLICEVSGKRLEKSLRFVDLIKYPVRFDGYICLFCLAGETRVDLNLNTYEIKPNTLLINVPGNIVKLPEMSEEEIGRMQIVFVALSRPFMSSIRFDFNRLFQESLQILDNPCIHLDAEQFDIARDYFVIANKIINSPAQNKREIIGSLISSLSYMAADIWSRNIAAATHVERGSNARLQQVFDRFIALVTEFHTSERNMAFYADKLCLTPKYLSKLVKQASGRSAPDWIDAFVILEAKNMLRYSDATIKEIVYKLHFPNQSVFYKFFKAHTGLTPSAYRNG